MDKMTVRDIEVAGKKVLVRVDFNVPLDPVTGAITDDSRITATLPTIKYLIERDARVILMSHMGRPKGKFNKQFSLTGVAQRLSQILGQPVEMATDCIGPAVEKSVAALKSKDVLLLENLRFYEDEENGSDSFAQALARLGDLFVNDAFGTSHRAHASISIIAKYLPAVAGFLLEKEINFLGRTLENPARPFAALVGGAKISDKVKMLERISNVVDYLIIGGGMVGTFLKTQQYEIGKSLFEPNHLGLATKLLNKADENRIIILIPDDVVVADRIDAKENQVVSKNNIPADKMIVDIGPQTVSRFSEALKKCETVFWNGPMGVYEYPQSQKGTREMATLLAGLEATTVIGGGSTAEVVTEMGLADSMTFVSTGGGASMSFVSGEKLPGVEALMDKKP